MTAYGLLKRRRKASPTGTRATSLPSIASIMTSSSVYTARLRARSPTPRASIAAKPLGPSCSPAPISPIWADCSKSSTASPLWLNASATAMPPMPPPTTSTGADRSGRTLTAALASTLLVHAELALQRRFVGTYQIERRAAGAVCEAHRGEPRRTESIGMPERNRGVVHLRLAIALDRMEDARRRVAGENDILARAKQQRREGQCVQALAARFRIHISDLHRGAGFARAGERLQCVARASPFVAQQRVRSLRPLAMSNGRQSAGGVAVSGRVRSLRSPFDRIRNVEVDHQGQIEHIEPDHR